MTILAGAAAYAAAEKDQHLRAWDGVWWAVDTVRWSVTARAAHQRRQGDRGRDQIMGIGFIAILAAAAAVRFLRDQHAEVTRSKPQLDAVLRRLDGIEPRPA